MQRWSTIARPSGAKGPRHPPRRHLATGTVYINALPNRITSAAEILAIAQKHSIVYSVWTRPADLRATSTAARRVAVRLVTERIPPTVAEISRLPDPTTEDVAALTAQLLEISGDIEARLNVPCVPVASDPGMFQSSARAALGLGPETRTFDLATTDSPNYTRGLVDGYRKGFRAARLKKEKDDVLRLSAEADDELEFLLAYLSSPYSRNRTF
ncbi:hypothetical protein GGI11_007036 [Coemansia sp. RSA 2049]|nr:hypothetical protein GGI11_007036 [Coemansia sp. RSA 2049]KAJ2523507.1 hypothetical protein H4217_000024 [Coemansia sp. RSA 1939]KAJ2618318.1 hypothetical protein EV177_000037 [Coemansia sp. RSA 1804]KAJ2695629.1 hypothetical protein GGH99_000022 [Coemansia sp. RSA 1285]